MEKRQLIQRLLLLHRVCQAGERGFEVVAANVSQRGLKVLLKTYAQQRAQFADELQHEIQRLGKQVSGTDSLLGIIHRGRINILAALTIGAQNVEKVVLGEAILGEQAALRLYKSTLTKPLPPESQTLVERHYQQIQAACEHIELLRGQSGKRWVVELFDSDRDVAVVSQALRQAGFSPDNIETVEAKQITRLHVTRGSRVRETVVAGAVGGAIWGGLVGAIVGISALMVPDVQLPITGSPLSLLVVTTLGSLLLGALGAAFLGFLIGVGISEEDAYLYQDSMRHGIKLVSLRTDYEHAAEAARIMQSMAEAAKTLNKEGTLDTVIGS